MKPLSERDALIVCFGKRMDKLCAAVIVEIGGRPSQCRLQFVMSDWISSAQLASASVFWVVDPSTEMAEIAPVLRYGIPLLVPEASSTLAEACITSKGLFYQTEAEATSSLIRLVTAVTAQQAMRL